MGNGKTLQLTLDEGADAMIERAGVTVRFNANGKVSVRAKGTTIVVNDNGVIEMQAANDTAATGKAAPQIGDADDGGVYVGLSATTGKPLHAASADEPEYLSFSEAFAVAEHMKALPGRENAHVPTPEELNVNLYQNKDEGALKGTFNTSGSFPACCYRSSAPSGNLDARVQWFDGGVQSNDVRDNRLPVRLVW